MKLFSKLNLFMKWLQLSLTKRQFIILSSVLIGLSVSIVAIILKSFVHFLYSFKENISLTNFNYLIFIFPLIGVVVSVFMVQKLMKGKLEKGLKSIHNDIVNNSSLVPPQQMYAQVLTSSISVGFGGSAGLEAPISITGAAFGSNYARTYRLNQNERTLLLACGVAAGIGSAFNAPIAGVLFALEVLLLDIGISAFTPLIISSATAALLSKIVLNDDVFLYFKLQQAFDYKNVPYYVILAIISGVVSVYHGRVFSKIELLFEKSRKSEFKKALFGAFLLSVLILLFPALYGEGYQSIKNLSLEQANELFKNSLFFNIDSNQIYLLICVGILVFLKAIATGLTISSGGNGGNFAPSLFVGSYLGFVVSRMINLFNFTEVPESNFTIVGMAGVLSGLYHAPLTAIFLIAEITGGYSLIIPLMIVSSISFAISKYFEPFSIDTKALVKQGKFLTNDRDYNVLNTMQLSDFIEKNFQILDPNDSLEFLIDGIAKSNRNIFPVVNKDSELIGVVMLDNIRDVIFKPKLNQFIKVKDLMVIPPAIIEINQSMDYIMSKFDETNSWNLPVVKAGVYIGFISKSSLFSHYRDHLKSITIN